MRRSKGKQIFLPKIDLVFIHFSVYLSESRQKEKCNCCNCSRQGSISLDVPIWAQDEILIIYSCSEQQKYYLREIQEVLLHFIFMCII